MRGRAASAPSLSGARLRQARDLLLRILAKARRRAVAAGRRARHPDRVGDHTNDTPIPARSLTRQRSKFRGLCPGYASPGKMLESLAWPTASCGPEPTAT